MSEEMIDKLARLTRVDVPRNVPGKDEKIKNIIKIEFPSHLEGFGTKPKKERAVMEKLEKPTSVGGLESGLIIESRNIFFKGLDGEEYQTAEALFSANQEWFRQNNKYISPWTGREYSSYEAAQEGETEYWKKQFKPKALIVNKNIT